jgi:hypothetical protein
MEGVVVGSDDQKERLGREFMEKVAEHIRAHQAMIIESTGLRCSLHCIVRFLIDGGSSLGPQQGT